MLPLLFGVLPAYGLCLLIAFLAGSEVAAQVAPEAGVRRNQALAAATLALLAGVGGSRLVYLIEQRAQLSEAVQLGRGGLTFVGSIPAAVLMVLLTARRWRLSFAQLADPLSHAAALGQAIGRLGCFAAGCCYGLPSTRLGIHFAEGSVAGPNLARFPMQLVEAALSLGLFFLLRSHRAWLTIPYRTFSIYLAGAAIVRLGTESWRGDRILLGAGFSVAMAESLVVLLFGLGLLWWSRRARAKMPQP